VESPRKITSRLLRESRRRAALNDRGSKSAALEPARAGPQSARRAGSTIRVNHQAGRWEAIPRALIEDQNLSFLARWFAIWLASRPPGWEIRAGVLPRLLKDRSRPSGHLGRDSTRRALKELQETGYLIRRRYQDSTGKWVWQSCFNATKNVPSAMPWNSVDGESVDGNSGDITNTELAPKLINSTPTTTTDTERSTPTGTEVVVVTSGCELEFPEILKGPVAQSAVTLIERCPAPLRQSVLDEIRMLASKNKVRSPIGLLHRLVERAVSGTFVASQARSKKIQTPQHSGNVSQSDARRSITWSPPVASSEFAQQRLAELRRKWR